MQYFHHVIKLSNSTPLLSSSVLESFLFLISSKLSGWVSGKFTRAFLLETRLPRTRNKLQGLSSVSFNHPPILVDSTNDGRFYQFGFVQLSVIPLVPFYLLNHTHTFLKDVIPPPLNILCLALILWNIMPSLIVDLNFYQILKITYFCQPIQPIYMC